MQTQKTVIVVGAGPAGLMAAEVICAAGHKVKVY
ncbi:MAG: NAD(P)/FAD-dependent oxidoreductase, partial [Psychromonas sp.]